MIPNIKTIAFIFFFICIVNADAEKLVINQEYIYEYSQKRGAIVFEIQANLVKNNAEYLMIEVESLTSRSDVQIFVSFSGKTPYTQQDSDILCSRFEYDICLIPATLVKKQNPNSDDVLVTFTVSCNNNCSFEVFISYENNQPLSLNDEKILIVKENNEMNLNVTIKNTPEMPISTFILEVDLLNPVEVKHYFSMVLYGSDPTTAVYEADQLGNGPIKGVYEIRGDKICRGECSLTMKIIAIKGSILKINSYGYNAVRQIQPFKIYSDQVDQSTQLVMKLDLTYFQPISHVDLTQKIINFQLVPKTGSCSLSVNVGQKQPANINEYMFQQSEDDIHHIRIHYSQHQVNDHIYWLGIQANKSKCLFSVKVDFVDESNQQITLNHPITSFTKQGQIEQYKLTLLGNHPQKIKAILSSDNHLTELFVKICKHLEDCSISMKDIQHKSGSGILGYSGSQSAQSKVIKFNHIPENCPDFKPYNDIYDTFPSCTYLIAIYSNSADTKFTIETTSSNQYINYITIRENDSFFDDVAEFDQNVYRFQVAEETEELKFVVKPQFGEVTFAAFFSHDGANVDFNDKFYAIQESQWNEITFKSPKIGFYYIVVSGTTDSQYTVTPVVDRPENRGEINILKLKQDIPHQVISENSSKPSYFEISIINFENTYPELWVKLDQNSNEFDVYITQDKSILSSDDIKKYQWSFTNPSKSDIHLDSNITKSIILKKLYIKVVPKHNNISQFFVIKYHFNFSYYTLEYSKPVKGHISQDGYVLYKIPVSGNSNIQITKTVLNNRQQSMKIQVDFNEIFSNLQGFYNESFHDMLSVPGQMVQEGCTLQKSDICYMYINIYSQQDSDYQIQIDEQIDGTTIMAYDGYSNLLLTPTIQSPPVQVNYVINKPETIIVSTQIVKGLYLCATIVNAKNQFEMIEFPSMNDCVFKSDDKDFYDHTYLKIPKKDVEEQCKFNDHKLICGLTISVYNKAGQDAKQKFRLSISSGVTDLYKGKPAIGHAEIQNMEYFRYVSKSEDPIKIHLMPLDSSDLELFVIFGDENRPTAFKDLGWSLELQNFDDNILEINSPLPIQNGSLQGVYMIGVYCKSSYSRFQITVTQELLHVQELHQNSVYSLRIPSNQSLYFEYSPNIVETEFTIKLVSQYGNPKIAIKQSKIGHLTDKALPDILNGDYTLSNKYDLESDELRVRLANCDDCIFLIQVYSYGENSKFVLHITSSNTQHMLYNHVYAYKFQEERRTQKLQYHSQEIGYIQINMEYGDADVQIVGNGKENMYKLLYFLNILYANGQDLTISVTCNECSFTVQVVKIDDLMTYKFGQMKYFVIEPNEEYKMQFSFNPIASVESIKLNLMVENEESDSQNMMKFKPEVKILCIEKRYSDPIIIPIKVHKFHTSYTIQFNAKQGMYSIAIKWPYDSRNIIPGQEPERLFLKAFMTSNQSVFLQPYVHFSSHLKNGETTEIIQKKSVSSTKLKNHELGMEFVIHVCSGILSSMVASPFYRDSFFLENSNTHEQMSAFTMITNNIFVFDDVSVNKELFIQLTAGSNDTFFNIHTQPIAQNAISLYKQIFLKEEQILFDLKDDKVDLYFEGVQLLDTYKKEDQIPIIKYQVYFFKKLADVQNSLCPRIDLLELEGDSNQKMNLDKKNLETGLHLVSFTTSQFNNVEHFQVEKSKIMDERNFNDFYFTVQAQVSYNGQEANLLYNIEKIHQIVITESKTENSEFNWILYAIIAASAIAIIFLVILVRRKMNYGLLPEIADVQLEQVGQQEVSSIKAPNHVISPNMSIVIQHENKPSGSQAVFMSPSSTTSIGPSTINNFKNDQNV